MSFSNRLKRIRNEKNLTQKNIAEILKITERSYRCYELGNRQPNLDKIVKLSEILGVSIDYLLCRTDDPNPMKVD